jgi:Dolichyl-phosphate-mannose-protein mannosyltransferase
MALVMAICLCLASGSLIVGIALPPERCKAPNLLLGLSLSSGFGLGLFSIVYFLNRLLGIANLVAADLIVFTLLLAVFLTRSRTVIGVLDGAPGQPQPRTSIELIVAISCAIAVGAALYSSILRVMVHPHGDGWDAFSIWNLHARFLFRGNAAWRDGFSSLIPWAHPDYPLLLPAAIAHLWSYLGRENQSVPATVGLLFTFSTIALLFSSLEFLRGRTIAMLGAFTLSSTPFFIEQSASQYADVPTSYFYLAAISLLCLHTRETSRNQTSHRYGFVILGSIAASLAAWTKNEGWSFLCALAAAQILELLRSRYSLRNRIPAFPPSNQYKLTTSKSCWIFASAAVPVLLVVLTFKHFIAPAGDLFGDRQTALHNLADPARYWIIVQWYAKELLRFGDWFLVPGTIALAVFYFLVRRGEEKPPEPGLRTGALTLLFTASVYFFVYMITPHDIYWHLRFSLNRVFLQLWPSTIFLFLLGTSSISEKAAHLSELESLTGRENRQ